MILQRNESPEPVFETDPERTSFLAILPVHTLFLGADEDEFSLSETEFSIIDFCYEKPASKSEIAQHLKLTPLSGTLKRVLPILVAEGFLHIQYRTNSTAAHRNIRLQDGLLTTLIDPANPDEMLC